MITFFNRNKQKHTSIIAPIDGQLIQIEKVNDPVFSQKIMGDGVAFIADGNVINVCAPASGILSVLFPTGHAFGITLANGVEILVHIGLDTVNAKGEGFEMLDKKQGDSVESGDEIVRVHINELKEKYDMTIMLIITKSNEQQIHFIAPSSVKQGQSILL